MSQTEFLAICPSLVKQIPTGQATVVESHAGTGKTFTIEHLVIDLLLRPELPDLSLEQILVVTFTDKATIELKTRIREKLEKLVSISCSERPLDSDSIWTIGPRERSRLQQALFSFDLASIFTIHGFCNRVLADQAFDGNRLFHTELGECRERFQEAFHRVLRETPALPDLLLPLLKLFLIDDSPEALEKDLWSLFKSGVRHPALAFAPKLPLAEEPNTILTDLKLAFSRFPTSVDWVKVRKAKPRANTVSKLNQWMNTIQESVDLSLKESSLVPLFQSGVGEALGALRKDLAKDGFQPTDPEGTLIFNTIFSFPDLSSLLIGQIFPLVQAHLESDKISAGWHDFDDILRDTWLALSETDAKRGFCANLQDRYRIALIDEFQDTDPIQWGIFHRLFFHTGKNHTLVLIGDPKQAIYGFRGADVETYLRAREDVRSAGGNVLTLDRNFRSTPDVITFYNRLFENSFFTAPGISYDNPVRPGRPDLKLVDRNGVVQPGVELLQIPDDVTGIVPRLRLLGQKIARSIKRLLSPSGELFLAEGNTPPIPIRGRGIFVLTRSIRESRKIAELLREEGVPCAFFKEEGLFQSPEALGIVELFDAILHPEDATRINRALLSPFFGCRAEDLFQFRETTGGKMVMTLMTSWHQEAMTGKISLLLSRIRRESGYVRRLLLTQDSPRSLANLGHLFEILTEEAEAGKATLEDLWRNLLHWTRLSGEQIHGINNLQRLETDLEAVQILTMHKSKGLEADVVYFFGGFSDPPQRTPVVIRAGEPRAVTGALHPEDTDVLSRIQQSENERLLYVALTRARARLCLPVVTSEAKKANTGVFGCLQNRLRSLNDSPVSFPQTDKDSSKDFDSDSFRSAASSSALPTMIPQVFLSSEEAGSLIRSLSGFRLHSYSSLKISNRQDEPSEDLLFADPRVPDSQERIGPVSETAMNLLPRGAAFGVFVHEILENVPLDTFAVSSCDEWQMVPEVQNLVKRELLKAAIDEIHLPVIFHLVYAAYTTPFKIYGTTDLVRLADCPEQVREFDFHFCQTNEVRHDDAHSEAPDLIKGFMDVLFRFQGRWYFVDWKTDYLENYLQDTVRSAVEDSYNLQAQLYSLALARLLDVNPSDDTHQEKYERSIGGFLYVFLRGLDEPEQGVFSGYTSWSELQALHRYISSLNRIGDRNHE